VEDYKVKNEQKSEIARHIAALDGGLLDTKHWLISQYGESRGKDEFYKSMHQSISDIEKKLED